MSLAPPFGLAYFGYLCVLTGILLSPSSGSAQIGASHPVPQVQPRTGDPVADFVDVAAAANLHSVTTIGGRTSKHFILETTGGGVALFDFDGDGWLDIYLVNGTTLDAAPDAATPGYLYRNNHDGTFTDVTEKAGIKAHGWGQGVAVGDVDGDGRPDLFLTFYGQNVLYHNNGNGTFTDMTVSSGLQTATPQYSTGAAFLDYDHDGHLDLFVAHYLAYEEAKSHDAAHGDKCSWRTLPVMCGPRGLKGAKATLYRNRGDGTFVDVSSQAGVLVGDTYGFTPLVLDYNNDGWPDVYLASDSTPSLLFTNQRNGTFVESGSLSGVAYNEDGREQSGMGVAAADVRHAGLLDLVKTNFEQDTSTFYRNLGDGTFEDETFPAGLGVNTSFVGWGVGFLDFDSDGFADLLIANGHVYPEVNSLKDTSFAERRILYRNRGDGTFEDVSLRAGPGILAPFSSRGVALGDLFNTGQSDIVINNMNAAPSLLHNRLRSHNHSLTIALKGKAPNSAALGARVTVHAGSSQQMAEVQSGGSYLSQNDLRLRFGLGVHERAERVEIRWPDGTVNTLSDVAAGQILTISYGGKVLAAQPYAREPEALQSIPTALPDKQNPRK